MSFIEELKRRNVFRVGIAYGVASWVLLQIADLVVDNIAAPDWVMPMLMLLVSLGFVAALLVAWAYEMTPEGIKREADVDRSQSVTGHTAKKLDVITLGAVGVLIALLLADRFLPATDESPNPADVASTAAPATEVPEAVIESPSLERGIAVLPFANLSEDAGNAFFAGGVHEDVLTNLSRIADLRVISRTSMIKIAEQGLDIREIGQELGVSHVLEGSVRRAGEQVRVTVQLIDASNDAHLWADNFDRKLDDIFAIQSEIAQKIASQLEVELSPEQVQQMAEAPTQNLEAYDLYQKAREMGEVWLGAEGFRQQIPLLEQAAALDPQFKAAQIDLMTAYGRMVWTGSDPDGNYREKVTNLFEQISTTWPDGPERNMAIGKYTYTIERDYQKALELFLKVLPHQPGDSELLLSIASCYKRLERFDLGLPVIERALSLDPHHPAMHGELGFHLLGNGKSTEALQHFRKGVELFPDDLSGRYNLANYALKTEGNADEYFKQLAAIRQRQPQSQFLDQLYYRMQLADSDLDAVLEQKDALRDEDTSWKNISIDYEAAELLNIAGREAESVHRARRSLNSIQGLLGAGQPLPGNTPKMLYAQFAYTACMAGDKGAFNQYRSVFQAVKASEIGIVYFANQQLAIALAECGDAQAGWDLLTTTIQTTFGIEEWEIVLDPIYAHYFSDLPEFQALVKKKNAEKAAAK